MKKILTVLLLCCSYSISYAAIPNYWESYMGKGFESYMISNPEGNEITLSCNEAAATVMEHNISLYPKGRRYPALRSSDNLPPVVDFLIDNKVYNFPNDSSIYGNSVRWYNFIKVLSEATQFDVYWNGTFFGSFAPKNLEVISDYAQCKSIFDRDNEENNFP